MADTTKVPQPRVSEKDVGAEVDGLSDPLELTGCAREPRQIHRLVNACA
jgi:hypothetical protein